MAQRFGTRDPGGPRGEPGAGDQRLVAQERDPRVIAVKATRRRLERRAEDLEPGPFGGRHGALELGARAVIDDRLPKARELVACHDVVARARKQPCGRELGVER